MLSADSIHRSNRRTLVLFIGSFRAVRWTLENLYREGDVLHLLHVVPQVTSFVPQAFSLAHTMPQEEGLQEQMAQHALEYMEQKLMKLADKYSASCEIDLVLHGPCNQTVSHTICSKCEDLEAAVVVLSVQKKGLLESIFQTSISQQVADKCEQPTLIFHD